MRRHNRRRQYRHPSGYYVVPVRARRSVDQWGTPVPGVWDRSDMDEALFVPGVSSDEQMLSDAVQARAQLFFQVRVDVLSTDHVEIPDEGRWSVVGHPNHWPMGTVLTLSRSA